MAPITRSQTRNILGLFVKNVLEHPPVMDCVLKHLDTSTNKETFDNLLNVRLVFNYQPTVDVIQRHITLVKENEQNHIDKCSVSFVAHTKILLEYASQNTIHGDVYLDIENVKNLYEYIILNKDIFIILKNRPSIIRLKKTAIERLKFFNKENIPFRLIHGNRLLKEMKTF
jgi:hypothetical protein